MDVSLDYVLNIKGANLIDIRDRYRYMMGTILESRNISETELMFRPSNYLNMEDKYYIFCEYGNRSRRLCEILREKGYLVYNIVGGYNRYKLEK